MRRLGWLVTGVLLTATGRGFAQETNKGEVAGGWRYYHATLASAVHPFELKMPNDLAKGWFTDAALNLSPKFAVVGEAGGVYHSDALSKTQGSVSIQESLKFSFHTFMGGVRVRAPQRPAFIPFGQVLFGGEHDASASDRTLTFSSGSPSISHYKAGSSGAVLALDGGATIKAGAIGVRASVGYVRFFGTADADAFRLSLGAAFRF